MPSLTARNVKKPRIKTRKAKCKYDVTDFSNTGQFLLVVVGCVLALNHVTR